MRKLKLSILWIVAYLLASPLVFAASGGTGQSAAQTAIQTLAQWAQPVIQAVAVILLIVGILASAFEFFKRAVGWALGLFIGSTVIFAVLWALSTQASSILNSIASALNVSG